MKATVLVRLKEEVLDPQGDAVRAALGKLGFGAVKKVRVGKLIELELEDAPEHVGQAGHAKVKETLTRLADEMLANPVIEDFEIQV